MRRAGRVFIRLAVTLLPLASQAEPGVPEAQVAPPVSVTLTGEPQFSLRRGFLVRDILDTAPVPMMMGTTLKNSRTTIKKMGGEAANEEWTACLSYGFTLVTTAKRLRAPTVYLVFLVKDASTALSVWGVQVPGVAAQGAFGSPERLDAEGVTLTNKLSLLSGGTDASSPPSVAYDATKLSSFRMDKLKLSTGGVDWTKDKILAWRLEVWHLGRFLTGYTRQNAEKLKELNLPPEWYTRNLGKLVAQ